MIKDTGRYSVLHNKYTSSDSWLPNTSIGSELQGAMASEVKLDFGLKRKIFYTKS